MRLSCWRWGKRRGSKLKVCPTLFELVHLDILSPMLLWLSSIQKLDYFARLTLSVKFGWTHLHYRVVFGHYRNILRLYSMLDHIDSRTVALLPSLWSPNFFAPAFWDVSLKAKYSFSAYTKTDCARKSSGLSMEERPPSTAISSFST
ncbi:meiotically up-regulated gene 62 protein [Histoplasma capsulatum G186AR]|uniref:Meiotically up-regulated gene 62 protein n=1 Tax=Ajellomyces capsulatus TaxID=5037 RepID=A0A8H7YX69_AJECA|nr:meiotically up-regulated gene 62 protein [Histoplasma capsulatum]QSS73126.1 meiotically up-regulated gene 62 protein [Histoplasma capsulatum G186AR]